MKKCTKCKLTKDLTEFNKNKTKLDGLNNICRDCSKNRSKKYYEHNKQKHKDIVYINNSKVRLENRRKVFEYQKAEKCIDCGESDPIVLVFDHRDGTNKIADVSILLGRSYSWDKIKAEIDKCDVRCANCHARRTAKQFNWYKDLIDSSS